MTPACRCEELEAVVERMRESLQEAKNWICGHRDFGHTKMMRRLDKSLSSPTLSSILARREAEQAVIQVARFAEEFGIEWAKEHQKDDHMVTLDHKDENGLADLVHDLCVAIARLDQLEKEKA